jgi:Fic family protein
LAKIRDKNPVKTGDALFGLSRAMTRKYQQTHPWITFSLNLSDAGWLLWVQLGEAASKCVHLTNVPLRPETGRRLQSLYLAKGAAATTAIEGNTLTEEEVLQHIEKGLKMPPSKEYLTREVDNIVDACNEIGRQLAQDNRLPPLSAELIRAYNLQVRKNLPEPEDLAPPGELRTGSVLVGGVYRGAPAEDCAELLDRMCDWLEGDGFKPQRGYALPFAILKAIVAHVYLAWIHPFDDGNGRTARLLELHILLEAGVPAPAAHLLSNHYNATRQEYYRQLDFASKSNGDLLPFIRYAVQGFVDGLREQLKYVWDQQWDAAWQNHVHDIFKGKDGASGTRQRRLALDLGMAEDWVEIQSIDELTPRLAKAYAGKSQKTLQRDLNDLQKLDLIQRRPGKVRANRQIIHAFRPLRRKAEPPTAD